MTWLKVLAYAYKRGVATHPYPLEPIEVDEHYRGRPVLDPEACMACGACANVCPAETIRVEVDPEKGVKRWTIYYGRCIFCGRCHEVCPVGAIKLSREFELAAKSREDLTVDAEFRLGECKGCGGHLEVTVRQAELATKLLEASKELSPAADALVAYVWMCSKCKRASFAEKLVEARKAYGG